MTPIQEVVQVIQQASGNWMVYEDNVAYILKKMFDYAGQQNPDGLQCVLRYALNEQYTGAVDMKKLEFGNPWEDYR